MISLPRRRRRRIPISHERIPRLSLHIRTSILQYLEHAHGLLDHGYRKPSYRTAKAKDIENTNYRDQLVLCPSLHGCNFTWFRASRQQETHLFAIRMTPSARVTVTQMGKPSGIAATARDTPMLNISSSFLPCGHHTTSTAVAGALVKSSNGDGNTSPRCHPLVKQGFTLRTYVEAHDDDRKTRVHLVCQSYQNKTCSPAASRRAR